MPTSSFDVGLGPMDWCHVVYYGVAIPLLAVLDRRKVLPDDRPLPDRAVFFRRASVGVIALAALSILVAWDQWIVLFPLRLPPLPAVGAGVLTYLASVAFMRPR